MSWLTSWLQEMAPPTSEVIPDVLGTLGTYSSSSKLSMTPTASISNEIVIVVFGLTGSGKSTIISNLTGKDLKIGHGLQSCEHLFPSTLK